MANDEHIALLKQGVQAWNAWRRENPKVDPDLGGADLSWPSLSDVDLSGANLSKADLSWGNLRRHEPKIRSARATAPEVMVPFRPIIQEGEKPFAMLEDLWIQHREDRKSVV